jgi:para-nitrobenzyl esterase
MVLRQDPLPSDDSGRDDLAPPPGCMLVVVRRRGARAAGGITIVLLVALVPACSGGSGGTAGGDSVPRERPTTSTTALPSGVEVPTAEGPVVGSDDGATRTFAGIPYAAPPVGSRRFAPPEPAPERPAPLDATRPRPACVQPRAGSSEISEDCLHLNITTPNPPQPDRPVLVWIPGGSFISGQGADEDPRRLVADHDVVVVTVNHRLGVLGFLAHPQLSTEAADGASGNQGLGDQRAALRWVRTNIAAFGGDPRNVTLLGQSSGASSGCLHTVSPASEGLFDRVVLQSGVCALTGNETPTLAQGEASGVAIATALGCDPVTAAACLRAATPDALAEAVEDAGLAAVVAGTPLVDGTSLPDQPATLLVGGEVADVPVVVGSTRDEATIFIAEQISANGRAPAAAQYEAILATAYGTTRAVELAGAYPMASFPTTAQALAAVRTDQLACAIDDTARRYAEHVPTYRYEFADRTSPPRVVAPDLDLGAAHGAELPYLFHTLSYTLSGSNPASLTPAQEHVSDQLTSAWTSFAADGDPNGDGAPTWDQADPDDDARLVFTSMGARQADGFREQHRCDTWLR